MTVLELLEAMGGDILANKARVVVDGQIVDVGYFDGPELVFTDAGKEIAAAQSHLAPAKAARKSKAVEVESPVAAPEPAAEQ